MADKAVETQEVPVEEVEKDKKAKVAEEVPAAKDVEETKDKEEESKENGDAEKKNGNDTTNGTTEEEEGENKDKCCIKRKSTGGAGDAPDGTPAEGATPEKKAKIDETVAEAESNGEAEVAA